MIYEIPKKQSDEALIRDCRHIAKNHVTTIEAAYLNELIDRYQNKLKIKTDAPGSGHIHSEIGKGVPDPAAEQIAHRRWMRMAIIRYTLVLISGIIFIWQAYKYLFCNSPIDYLYFVGAIFAYLMAYFIYHINRSYNGSEKR